jgi:hypothetical protein
VFTVLFILLKFGAEDIDYDDNMSVLSILRVISPLLAVSCKMEKEAAVSGIVAEG